MRVNGARDVRTGELKLGFHVINAGTGIGAWVSSVRSRRECEGGRGECASSGGVGAELVGLAGLWSERDGG